MSKRHIYKGINFRSLLEWDWARFLDWERIPWVYEPVTFFNKAGRYTPDFQVGNENIYFEAKGTLLHLNKHIDACIYPLIFALGGPKEGQILLFLDGKPTARYSDWHAAYDGAGRLLNPPTSPTLGNTQQRRARAIPAEGKTPMAVINTRLSGRAVKSFILLESDVYRMVIKKAEIEADQYAEPDENGIYPDKLVLTWEVYEATEEQDTEVVGQAVWQRMTPWYGAGKRGPSAFKTLMDSLVEQAILKDFDPDNFDTDALVGIKQRINVEKYIKSMGPNTGQPGNRIIGKPMPIARRRPTTQLARSAQPRNVPVAVAEDGEDDELF